MKAVEIAGERYNRLVALERVKGGIWRFKCDCGNQVERKAAFVRYGSVKSCGCLIRDRQAERCTTHGLSKHPLYWRWAGMIARCTNPSHTAYANYGGRGIKVCERWRSFENFLADMGNPPTLAHSIDRRDVNGDYTPENCFWATRAKQARNTRRNRFIEHAGQRLTVRDWEHKMGVKRGTFQRRLDSGWNEILAVTLPVQPGKPLRRRICHS